MRCVIGTRGSKLALWQARAVAGAVRRAVPGVEVELRVISTTGDRVLDKPLAKIGDKGLFTKELERALLEGEVDLCVHSMKDVPAELADGCAIRAMLPRADVRDALVCGAGLRASALAELPGGTRVGTGSLRRTAQLRALFPQVEPVPIRGNVDTRLAKADGPDYDAVVLAAAGVERMGAAGRIACRLPVEHMLPAVGQGAIGVEARADDGRMAELALAVDDVATSMCVGAERRVLAALEGGCQVPLGAYARIEGGQLVLDAGVFSLDGREAARATVRRQLPAAGAGCPPAAGDVAESAAGHVVEALFADGARDILAGLREREGAS